MEKPDNIDVLSASDACTPSHTLAHAGALAHPSRTPAAPTARTHGAPKETRFPFTAKALDALRCKAGRFEVWDTLTPGLGLRVTAEKKSWSFTYTAPAGGRARLALGTYPATMIQAARERATEARGLVEAGIDPRTVNAEPATPPDAPKTMGQLIEERLELEVRGKLKTAADVEARYNKYIVPVVGSVPVADFKIDPHYNAVIDPIAKRGKLRMAGLVHTDLTGLMNFAISRGVREFSSIAKTKSKDPKTVRTRYLSTVEIPAFWHELPLAFVRSKNVQRILKLCLVTGQRLSEVAGMQRGELDWKELTWTIPAVRVKNGFTHVVPLSPQAVAIIREALAVNSNVTKWLFPNDAQSGPLPARVISKTLNRGIKGGEFSLGKFTPHDLRRTVGTQMLKKANGLGISKDDKYLILNHRSATKANVSDEVYDQNDYLDEKREALIKWGAFLAELVGAETELRVAA